MANGDDYPPYRVPNNPPPPPRALQLFALVFALAAAAAGFLGYGLWAGILAALSFVFGLVDYFQTRGVVEVPRSAVDAEGRLKAAKQEVR
jgi:hypothetical protein